MLEDTQQLCTEAQDAVIAGITELLYDLRKHNGGRYTSHARITSEAVLTAVMYSCKDLKNAVQAIGSLLHQDVKALRRAQKRVEAVSDMRDPGKILVREVACLNCAGCSQLNFGQCENIAMCGKLKTRDIELESGARSELPVLRSAIQKAGYERAATITPGMFVGSENAEEQEPYIISVALATEKVWTGEAS
jgi:hypothetical protein